ncbi:hypothetical protein HZC07_05755 [Candidatus Micrarchaeota archaeon]|nr:hypothetical protein [Candidatus Micrarchaeota archaeon]
MDESIDFCVKYPFLDAARRHIESLTLNEKILELAVERLKRALKGESATKMLFHESDKREEIASFAAARMILGTIRSHYVTNRFAVNESKIVRTYLDRESEVGLSTVASHFGITPLIENGKMFLDLPNYLKNSPRSLEYRLVNKRLINGSVEIKASEKNRLIEEAVKKHIEQIPLVKDAPDSIKEAGAKILAELPKYETRIVVKAGDHPPCVVRLLEEMKKHQNLPHHARWYLATYLLAIGTTEEQIVKMYSTLPDFNEKITSYQVSHIKKKGYNVPSCATIMTYGLCCAVCRIGSPLNWHPLSKDRKEAITKEKEAQI